MRGLSAGSRALLAFGLLLGLPVMGAGPIHAQSAQNAPEPPAAPPTSPAAPGSGTTSGMADGLRGWARDHQIAERLNGTVDGWYPRLGGITRGGGIAGGPGYRFHPLGGPVRVDVSAAVSHKAYVAADARIRWVSTAQERFQIWTDFRAEHFPQEDFYGVGLASRLDRQTSYTFDSSDMTVRAIVVPVRGLRVGLDVGRLHPSIAKGRDREFPSIEAFFTDTDAPGLAAQPPFVYTNAWFEFDRRDTPGHPRRGGRYQASYALWDDRSLDRHDFQQIQFRGVQYVPLTADGRHVIAGRVGVSYAQHASEDRIPFYLLPYVGGSDTLRSFREFRFRDEHTLWLTAEYAWTPLRFLSVAAFTDAGEARPDWASIGIRGLKHGYGVGLRAHTDSQQLLRFDVAGGGGEGWRTFLRLGTSF